MNLQPCRSNFNVPENHLGISCFYTEPNSGLSRAPDFVSNKLQMMLPMLTQDNILMTKDLEIIWWVVLKGVSQEQQNHLRTCLKMQILGPTQDLFSQILGWVQPSVLTCLLPSDSIGPWGGGHIFLQVPPVDLQRKWKLADLPWVTLLISNRTEIKSQVSWFPS